MSKRTDVIFDKIRSYALDIEREGKALSQAEVLVVIPEYIQGLEYYVAEITRLYDKLCEEVSNRDE